MALCFRTRDLLTALAALLAVNGGGVAAVVPFTEDFDDGPADWFNADGTAPVGWMASGGPDGGAFVTTDYLVPDPPPMFGAILFRGQDEFNSSGGAFEGDWIADGVTEFSFFVRHDAPAPLDVFARFATPSNFPGAAGISFSPVMPDVWTQITIPIAPDSPNIILEGFPFEDVFSNIGHVQVGINLTDELIGETITVDLDKVSIVPGPGGLLLMAGAALAAPRRRRRAR